MRSVSVVGLSVEAASVRGESVFGELFLSDNVVNAPAPIRVREVDVADLLLGMWACLSSAVIFGRRGNFHVPDTSFVFVSSLIDDKNVACRFMQGGVAYYEYSGDAITVARDLGGFILSAADTIRTLSPELAALTLGRMYLAVSGR